MAKPMPKLEMGSIEVVAPDGFEGIPYDEAIIYIEGHDSTSEIEVRCPGALRLAPRIVSAVNNHDSLVEALHEARMALFKIRACSIAGCEEGYGKPEKWADALFASHGDVAASLKTIDRALDAVSTQKEPS